MQRTRGVALAVGLAVAGAATLVLMVGAAAKRPEPPSARSAPDLPGRLDEVLDPLRPDQPYRHPTPAERATAATAAGRLLDTAPQIDPEVVAAFAGLGMSTVEDTDAGTGRRYALFASDPAAIRDGRAWGAIVVDLSGPVRVALQVPHPRTDIATERIGLDLFRRVPGSILMVAGAHRRAGGGAADVAHNTGSVFHVLAVELAARAVPQIQLHGYADQNLPDAQVVVSAGAGEPGPLALRIADRLTEHGFTACRGWAERCGRLEGTANAQGRAAEEAGSPFVHLEMSHTVRAGEHQRAALVAALVAADLTA
jgi:hypothetical protein